jgi:hypothetical protein
MVTGYWICERIRSFQSSAEPVWAVPLPPALSAWVVLAPVSPPLSSCGVEFGSAPGKVSDKDGVFRPL